MVSQYNHLTIKYLKLINHIGSKRTEWSHYQDDKEFDLGWVINEKSGKLTKQDKIKRKKLDAKKAIKGDLILLCQNNHFFGHRATHVVEIVDEPYEAKCIDDMWTRRVRIVWIAEKPWEKAPLTEDVIGKKFSFRSGNLVNVKASTIYLNLDKLKFE
ncbi:hypothetical protein [Nostoc sp. C110]|uniref:hypothetical protein n=1 Tax=Nostoc sp. C110 TaxID=3349876 RepID=UPI00370D1E2E